MPDWLDKEDIVGEMEQNLELRRQANRCAQLIGLFARVESIYRQVTGRTFQMLRLEPQVIKTQNLLGEAVREIVECIKAGNVAGYAYDPQDTDTGRNWREMSLADIQTFSQCLKYSLWDEFLLVHYDDTVMWGTSVLSGADDIWNVYKGLLQECRSAVINLDRMEYALLPFAKFRNLNEAPEYSLDAVRDRMAHAQAQDIEFSEKLDGSFMQMRYLGDSRFYAGMLVTSSGTMDSSRSHQLADVLAFLRRQGTEICRMTRENPDLTFIFEWISWDDSHVVGYGDDMQGLHLVGIRDVITGDQYPYRDVIRMAEHYGVPTTALHAMSLDEVLQSLPEESGVNREGYVLNIDGFLVKIKCPDFLNLTRNAEMSRSFNTIVKVAAEGKADDYISMLPASYQAEAWKKYRKIMTYEKDMLDLIERIYKEIPRELDRKEAMIVINGLDPAIREMVRARYFGKKLDIISRKKSNTIQYIRESDIDAFYA